MTRISALFLSVWLALMAPAAAQEAAPQQLPPEIAAVMEKITPQTGEIALTSAEATLDLGEEYIFYGESDARDILTKIWGNPPQAADGVLGLVMPAGSSPVTDAWGAVVSFDKTGYVSDEDAADTDYDELLRQLQEGTRQANTLREQQGYPTLDLVGWAESPVYDSSTHSVVWAKDLAFADSEVNSLNYDVRTLGRYGVLSLNLLAEMPQLDEIRVAAKDFASHASFNEGARYQDYNAATDATADYGVAGLIAGGAGAAAIAKKTGFLAIILKFIKPILIGLGVLFVAGFGVIKSFFGGKAEEEEYYEEGYYEEEEPLAEEAVSEQSEAGSDPNEPPAT
ncbi:MAG: DUF2167 domain-containing protein [Pseudomonadota bacterium]